MTREELEKQDSRLNKLCFDYQEKEKRIADLERENRLLGERCNQLLKDKGELTDKIEKMKCCGNCKYSNQESVYSIVCKVGGVDKSDYINIDDNQVCDKWEIKE